MKKDIESLSHTRWKCKYHIVFAPKEQGAYYCLEVTTHFYQINRQSFSADCLRLR